MSRVEQTNEELKKQLGQQLELLSMLANSYDQGSEVASKSMATSLRILLHDTSRSSSLLEQLKTKNTPIWDSCAEISGSPLENARRLGSYSGLLGLALGTNGGARYIPYLDDLPPFHGKNVLFDDFWNRPVFIDNNGNSFTRRDIVLTVADQDGGAHVDPQLDEKYVQLSRKNSMGWVASNDKVQPSAPPGPELAAIRQITHEVLKTFIPNYPRKGMVHGNTLAIMGGMGIKIAPNNSAVRTEVKQTFPGVGRNDPCPCGSNIKYKKCHGK